MTVTVCGVLCRESERRLRPVVRCSEFPDDTVGDTVCGGDWTGLLGWLAVCLEAGFEPAFDARRRFATGASTSTGGSVVALSAEADVG